MKNWISILILMMSCTSPKSRAETDIQGHRGARGLMPENSIEGFIKAVEVGATTLELDLVVSKDNKLIVSHEHFLSPDFCNDLHGIRVGIDTIFNLYKMTAEEIKKYDCGSLYHDRFPEQEKVKTYKPTLIEVFGVVEKYLHKHSLPPVNYNIELKTSIGTDSVFHPSPEVFSDLVYQLVSEYKLWDRVNIQSFDFRTLQYFNRTYPEVKLAMLIESESDWKKNIKELGFTPEIYSCYFQLLSREKVRQIQEAGMKVIPWTVNDVTDINEMIDWGVDGIISDYPNRVVEILTKYNE